MTLQIELSLEQEQRLRAVAQQSGLAPAEVLKKLVDDYLPPQIPEPELQDPTLALFARWEQEDAQKTLEESAAEERLWEAFEQGINESRRAQGMREL